MIYRGVMRMFNHPFHMTGEDYRIDFVRHGWLPFEIWHFSGQYISKLLGGHWFLLRTTLGTM